MRAALQQALEALEYRGASPWKKRQPAITAAKQALAEPESEPVAGNTGKPYVDGLIDSLLMPPAAMMSYELEKLHSECANIIHMMATQKPEPSKRDTGKAFEDGRRAMLDEVLRIAPGSVAVLLERLKEKA